MPECWYCCWGWSKVVHDIYVEACMKSSYEAMHFGPAHIVWEDENFDEKSIRYCLNLAENPRHHEIYSSAVSEEAHNAVVMSLRQLMDIPDHIRDPEPEEYAMAEENANPIDYPPAPVVVMAGNGWHKGANDA